MSYFKVEEFLITGKMPSDEIVRKIKEYHIGVMDLVRHHFGAPIMVSSNSGYRPVEWEKSHGRSGNSQHTFRGKGAADYTASDLDKLEEYIIKFSTYTRVCRYGSFIHCDHKKTVDNKRRYYKYVNGKWKFKKNI